MFRDMVKTYQYNLRLAEKNLRPDSSREAVFFPPRQYLTSPFFPPPDFMPFLVKAPGDRRR